MNFSKVFSIFLIVLFSYILNFIILGIHFPVDDNSPGVLNEVTTVQNDIYIEPDSTNIDIEKSNKAALQQPQPHEESPSDVVTYLISDISNEFWTSSKNEVEFLKICLITINI